MKKLLLGSIVLIVFSICICLFQISCQKDALASTNSSSSQSQLNIILYAIGYGGGATYFNSKASEYWIMNYDGTNAKNIPIVFNAAYKYSMHPRLSPDGKTIFFSALDGNYNSILFSCSIDGSNLKTLLTQNKSSLGSGANIEVGGAY